MAQIDIVMVFVAVSVVAVCLLLAWVASPRAERNLLAAAIRLLGLVVAGKLAQILTDKMENGLFKWFTFAAVVIAVALPAVWTASKFGRRHDHVT